MRAGTPAQLCGIFVLLLWSTCGHAETRFDILQNPDALQISWAKATTQEVLKTAADKAGYRTTFSEQAATQTIADGLLEGVDALDVLNKLLEQTNYTLTDDPAGQIINVVSMKGYSNTAAAAPTQDLTVTPPAHPSKFVPKPPTNFGAGTPEVARAIADIQAKRAAEQNAVFMKRAYGQQ